MPISSDDYVNFDGSEPGYAGGRGNGKGDISGIGDSSAFKEAYGYGYGNGYEGDSYCKEGCLSLPGGYLSEGFFGNGFGCGKGFGAGDDSGEGYG